MIMNKMTINGRVKLILSVKEGMLAASESSAADWSGMRNISALLLLCKP